MIRRLSLTLALVLGLAFVAPAAFAAECGESGPVVIVDAEDPSAICSESGSTDMTGVDLQALGSLETVLIETSTTACLASCDCCTTASDCPVIDGFTSVCNTEQWCHNGTGYGTCNYC